jgi:hypothetical protein
MTLPTSDLCGRLLANGRRRGHDHVHVPVVKFFNRPAPRPATSRGQRK